MCESLAQLLLREEHTYATTILHHF